MTAFTTTALEPRIVFSPHSVAVIGASANPNGHAGRAVENLKRTGFPGRIIPINPKYDELYGLACYPDIAAVEVPPEVAYVLLPAAGAVEAVRSAGKAGVKLAIVCSSGFSELGDHGGDLQDELREITLQYGIRIIGPNCIGVVSPAGQFVGAPTFNVTYDQKPGGIAILSHSGGIGVTVFNRAQEAGTGVHSLVSLGNEADMTMADLLESLLLDEQVHTIAMVIEQVRDPAKFLAVARQAIAAGKTLVTIKNGRSTAGSAAVAGHTGALAGDYAVFRAVAREAGMIEVATIDEMVDVLHLCDRLPRPAIGRRVAVVSPSGGETVYVADRAGAFDVELPPLPAEAAEKIQAWMPLGRPANPLDLTGQIIGDSELLAKVLGVLGELPDIDVLMVCLATWGPYDADAILSKVLAAAAEVNTPVVFTAWEAGDMTTRVVELLKGSGLAWFPSPDRALAALSLVDRRPAPVDDDGRPAPIVVPEPQGEGVLTERKALAVLGEAGVPVVRSELAKTVDEAIAIARGWGGDVVLKLDAPSVLHKSELGLVETELPDEERLRAGFDRLMARADEHRLDHGGVLVAEKRRGFEVIVGGVRDATFGPFVAVGAGGVLAEFLSDVALVSAPASPEAVREALQTLASREMLQGVRGTVNDLDALIDLVVDFSRVFAGSGWMGEVDLNPVMLGRRGSGAVAVDALVIRQDGGSE